MQRTEKAFNFLYVLLVFVIFILLCGRPNNAVSGGNQATTAAAKSFRANISDAAHGALPGQKGHAEVGISVDQFKAELKKRGFEAAEGNFLLWTIEDCPQSFEVMGTCYFNNPAAPYVLAVVPYWPDEYIDPATQGAFGATDPGYGASFRFDPKEAIVIFGYLPPKAAYFGMQSYLFTRKGDYQTDNATYSLINSIGATRRFLPQGPG